MAYMTKPFVDFLFAVAPYWFPLLIVYLVSIYLLIMRERFDPRTFIFWMAVVLILPFLGFALYLLYGSNLYASRRFGRKRAEDSRILSGEGDEPPEPQAATSRVLRAAGGDVYTSGNRASFHWELESSEADIVRDIESAQERIVLTCSGTQRIGRDVIEALRMRAKSGVDVRVITSGLGFGRTRGILRLRSAGARHATFHNPLYSMLSLRPAYRDHRGFMVVDGRVAYEGRGALVRIEGPAAGRLELRFRADWLHATGEDLGTDVPCERHEGGCGVQVVSDGPDLWEDSPMPACYARIISEARESIMISTPYLMPNDEIYATLKMAVLSGVRVTLLLPRKCRHWYQAWNSLSASNPLMMAGAKVYFADRGLRKCVLVADGRVCCVGSAEYCGRSMRNDFNTCCVIHSEAVASEAMACFEAEVGDAAECLPEEYRRRSFMDRSKIALARLLMLLN